MARVNNGAITYDDANYMITNEGFTRIGNSITGLKCMTRADIEAYMNADNGKFSGHASNRLIPYNLLQPSTPPTHTNLLGFSITSSAIACNNGGAGELSLVYILDGETFATATKLYNSDSSATYSASGYYSEVLTDIWRYWNSGSGSFGISGICQ